MKNTARNGDVSDFGPEKKKKEKDDVKTKKLDMGKYNAFG